jgi:hypothetical protein
MPKHKQIRSPRFTVPNNEQAVIKIGAEQLRGTLQLLSLNGGTMRLQKRLPSGTFADITLRTAGGTFTAAIEMLQMAKNNAQAFRFVAMGPASLGRLNTALSKMRDEGLAVEKSPLDHVRIFARRVLPRSAK